MILRVYNTHTKAAGVRMSLLPGMKGEYKMKNKKIIIIAASLVLAAALALCGCMKVISEPDDETKEYNPEEMTLPSVIEETPTAQSEMQKKFGAYGKEEIGENGEKIFRLFTEEQIEESLKLREDGIRRSLTFDEIVFIINDSVRMYFEYDKIIITDFVNHTHAESHGGLDFDMLIITNRYHRCEVSSLGYTEIIPYHGDYSDADSYKSALATYNKMIHDIESIILDRLRIHDTGTEGYCLTSYASLNDKTRLYGILFDGGELTDSEKYISTLRDNIKYSAASYRAAEPTYKYPLILAQEVCKPDSGKPQISIQYFDGGKGTQLFPTEQLEALRPDGSLILSGKTDDLPQREISFEFDRWTNIVTYTDKRAGFEITMTGGFYLEGDMIGMWFDHGMLIDNEDLYIKIVDGKIRVYDNLYYALYDDGKFKEEFVFECSSAYNEKFVFPDAFSENKQPVIIFY